MSRNNLTTGWRLVTLNDLQAEEPRAITDGPFGSHLTSAHYTNSGPRVVRLQNIGDGVFHDAPAHISEEHFQSLQAHAVLPGDLLVASLGEVLPRACLAPLRLGPAIVKADCIRVRLSPKVDSRWVMYSMQRPKIRRWAEEHRHGVGRPRLGLKVIRQIPVPLPPLKEQRRIVGILEDHLSRLDAGEANCEVAATRASTFRISLLSSALLARDDWPKMPLADLLDFSVGGLWGSERGVEAIDVRVLRVTELKRNGELDVSTAAIRSVSERQLAPRKLVPGDLLLEKSGGGPNTPVGRVGLVRGLNEPSICSNFMQLMRPRRYDVVPRFLHLYLNAFYLRGGTVPMQKASTNIRNIKASEYMKLLIPLPDTSTQEIIVGALEEHLLALDRLIGDLQQNRIRSAALRRAVFDAAFSGQLTGRATDMDLVEEMAGV